MSLEPGSTIGSYTITREVGRGGMGVVYLARDTRLDRDVAIKALPEELAADPARLERFEREARTLASLNHPNLAGIHGIEEQGGARYLVLEYVEGETIADILDRGPLNVDDALELAVQIAAGVEAAHDAGVIHRDLKPANIKVTPEGKAKVLDFGLARADDSAASSSSIGLSNSPTVTSPVQHSPTIAGAILGTAPYMSPEQARGRKVDKRTDIWSFAVVVYEMLTGVGPFHGETATDSIGAILHKDVDLGLLPRETPRSVRRVLERCLARDKGQRYRDIGDVRLELAHARGEGSVDAGPVRNGAPLAVLAALAVAALLAGGALAWLFKPAPEAVPAIPAHLTFDVPEGMEILSWPIPDVSRDGRRVVFSITKGDGRLIGVRDLSDPMVREISGTEGGFDAALSPDGRTVAYESSGVLYRRLIEGGPAIRICDTPNMRGGVWENDGSIVLAPERLGALQRVDAGGGEPVALYDIGDSTRISDRHPAMLPGSRGVLFHRCGGDGAGIGTSRLMVLKLDGSEPRELIRGASHGRFVAPGYLVFQRETSLLAAGFDLDTLELTTPEAVVLEGLAPTPPPAPAQFDVSPNGTLVYFTGEGQDAERRIVTVGFDGVVTPLSDHTGTYDEVVPSDDGRYLAIENSQESLQDRLSIVELGRNLVTPLAQSGMNGDYGPVWSPDNRWIAFTSDRDAESGVRQIFRFRVGSASPPEMLIQSSGYAEPMDWSSDGLLLVVCFERNELGYDLGVVRVEDSGEVVSEEIEPLIEWPGYQWGARLSPDDGLLLFSSFTELTGAQIFMARVDDPSMAVQVSVGGGNYSAWAPDGSRVYYVDDNAEPITVFAVEYEIGAGGEIIPSAPERVVDLETIDDLESLYMNTEGTAFIVTEPVSGVAAMNKRKPNVILNWTGMLEEAVSGGKTR